MPMVLDLFNISDAETYHMNSGTSYGGYTINKEVIDIGIGKSD